MISTICSLVNEGIDDYIEELMIVGNDGMRFSLPMIRWLKDCWNLGLHQIPT